MKNWICNHGKKILKIEAVFIYAFSLVFLFSKFYKSAYGKKEHIKW
jgi:hypothetical protein